MEECPRLVSSSFFWEPASESEGWEVSSFKNSVLVTLSSAFLESAFLRRRTTTGQSCLERRVLRATFLFSTVLSAHPTRWGRVASSIADLQRRLASRRNWIKILSQIREITSRASAKAARCHHVAPLPDVDLTVTLKRVFSRPSMQKHRRVCNFLADAARPPFHGEWENMYFAGCAI